MNNKQKGSVLPLGYQNRRQLGRKRPPAFFLIDRFTQVLRFDRSYLGQAIVNNQDM